MLAGRPRPFASILLLAGFIAFSAPARAAVPAPAFVGEVIPDGSDRPCGAEALLESLLASDAALAARRATYEAMVLEAQEKGLLKTTASTSGIVYTIPVAVHIVHNGGAENISYAQVLSQIAAINRDCQNLPGNVFPAADCQIQFCLATNLPQGSSVQWANAAEPGVTRTQSANTVVAINNDVALKAIDYLPSDQYLNVWVVQSITGGGGGGTILGYATFPGSVPAAQDGIVMDYRVMGADGVGYGNFATLLMNYKQGKVFAHEVGHWLDLLHTFHNACSPGDLVADTPPEAVNAWGCPSTVPSTCTSNGGDPIHNFMDYTDDGCRWQFTAGQKARMYAAIGTYRSKLVSPANLVATGGCPPTLFAVANLSATQTCVNTAVSCSAPNCGTCTYTWSFPGGVGNPNGQNTSVTYANPGVYTVTLTMSDGSNSSTATATVYVSACSPIAGTCTNWVWSTRCRLSFATGMPVAVGGTQNIAPETASQVSNSAGSLLFYSDGSQIFTAANTVMPNGTGIIGGNSAHTGSLILPVPGSTSTYFQFAVRQWEDGEQNDPLHYSVINMNLNGGLGDVASGFKNLNIPLPGTPRRLIEGMTLIPQCNGTDWWLITHGADSINVNNDWNKYIYVTPITSAGPGVSVAYSNGLGGPGTNYSAWGALTASKDGSRLAVIEAKGERIGIYNFNRVTGTPTLLLKTGDIDANQDVAFSPNGKILYYTYLKPGFTDRYGIRQYDIASQQVRTLTTPILPGGDLDVRLGPDDKVYVAPSASSTLHCINFPNQFNTLNLNECGFNPYSIPLGAGASTTYYGTLPNILPVCSASAQAAAFSWTVTTCTTVQFTSPNCGPWNWTFGDGGTSTLASPSHTYAPGTYTVTLNAPNASPSTIQQTVTIGNLPIAIAGPNPACGGPFNYSAVGPSNYQYSWTITGGVPTSATGNNVFVNWGLSSGTVTLTATDPATGCVSNAFMGVEACMTCTPPPPGMVAWWPLDEAAGTLAQDIVIANDGQDASPTSPAKTFGAVGQARQFDGATSVIRVNDHPKLDLGTGNLTIDAWINTSAGTGIRGIVEKRLLSPDRGYALYLKQGRLALLLGDGSTITEFWASGSTSLADGAWHHVAATEDRGDNAAGTRLYVDGSLIATFACYPASASLANSERLLIGAQEPAGAPSGWFNGKVDEVEIFNRALAGTEIAAVWAAGPAGKCKEFTRATASQTICEGQGSILATVNLCNLGTTAQSFNLTFAGANGNGCTGPLPTTFTMLGQNNPVPVPPGNCVPVTVKIDRPLGMVNGDISCFEVTATNINSNVAHVTRGSMWANQSLCPNLSYGGGVSWGGVLTPVSVSWKVRNTSGFTRSVPIFVEAHPGDESEPGPLSFISLNGLPPGTPWTATYVLEPNDSVAVDVQAQFLEARPFRFYDLVLYGDADSDGIPDAASSATVLYNDRTPQVTAVPEPPAAAGPIELRLLRVAPNPVDRAARVDFELPQLGWMRLALFDVGGRRVRTLADGLVPPGRHQRTLDARGLPSGVYFLRLETRGMARTMRVVLLKD
jgi:PKD repeat protein